MRRYTLLSTLFFSFPGFAANWELCSNQTLLKLPTFTQNNKRPEDERIDIYADSLKTVTPYTLLLNGDVHLLRKNDEIFAEQIIVNQQDQSISASGKITYLDNESYTKADSAQLQQSDSTGIFNNAELFSTANHSTIQADTILQQSATQKTLANIRYTTCEPSKPYWQLRAQSMQLNHKTGRGFAKHVQLRVLDIPFFYFPAFSFPIDDRRVSGFLYPSFANSDERGAEINIPWYWNIAPQADATFTSRVMSMRGWQFNSQWRYMRSNSRYLLHSENLYDKELDTNRWFYHFEQNSQFDNGWQTKIRSYNMADTAHLDDLDSEHQTSDDYLKRIIQFSNNRKAWNVDLLFQDYEFADTDASDASAPYQLLPRLSLSRTWNQSELNILGMNAGISSEYSQFDHASNTDTGGRWVNKLYSEKRFGNAGWFIKPKVSLHSTEYKTDNSDHDTRNLAITSIDSGLFFDRYTPSIQQTLEPRLYLLYIPYEDQSSLPNYDSSTASNSYAQLFQENRFSGSDRIGDTQQASIGLTSRVYDKASGAQKLRLQVGQSFYFNDRQVTLSGNTTDDSQESDIYTGIKWNFLANWQLNNDIAWTNGRNTENNTRQSRFSLQYRRDNNHLFYLGHSFDEDDLEQADINGRWRVNTRWTILGKYLYDLENKQNINRFAGIEYENCCVAIRLVGQRLLENSEQNDSLSFQLSLKGLSSFGKLNDSVTAGINGFQDNFEN